MARDFFKELKDICRRERKGILVNEKLYNLHKRSLPVGQDRIIMIGITKDEVPNMFSKSRLEHSNGNTTIIYFDLIPQEATRKELDIYFSGHRVVKEV